MTVPTSWRVRRLRLPLGLHLTFDDLADDQRTWVGPVPVTTPARTVLDCARDGVSPEFVAQAIEQWLGRGMFTKAMVSFLDPVLSDSAT